MTQFLRIVGWEKFQHYKDRAPPWIKLHRTLLQSQTWVELDDASRVLAVACMLLAADTGNRIPASKAYLRRVAYLNGEPDWTPLLRAQFIEIIDEAGNTLADASKTLAVDTKCSSEERREEERRGEQNHVELKLDSPPASNREPETNQQVLEVFSHWQSTWNKPRAKLDPKRRRLIHQALKLYDSDTLKRSIEGYRLSPHHCGQNERSTVYDDIELFLRDAKHIDAGIAFAEKGQAPVFR